MHLDRKPESRMANEVNCSKNMLLTDGVLCGEVEVLIDDVFGEVHVDRLRLEQLLVVGLAVDHTLL